jgi:hypothetical protein
MIARCHNPNSEKFPTYGAVGVRVCAEWHGTAGYERFLAHLGPKPTPQHTVDRFPNPSGNYEPGNVRWATPREQSWNSRNARMVTIGDETLPITEWARRSGISRRTIEHRLNAGVVGAVLLAPMHGPALRAAATRAERGEYELSLTGETLSVAELSRRTGIDRHGIVRRLRSGLTVEGILAAKIKTRTPEQVVVQIRERFAHGERVYVIAKSLGMAQNTVRRIALGLRRGAAA